MVRPRAAIYLQVTPPPRSDFVYCPADAFTSGMEHLIVIAGPTASGKTTLIRDLIAGHLPDLQVRLGAEDLRHWVQVGGNAIATILERDLAKVILHYDFLWSTSGSRDNEDWAVRRLLPAVARARRISLVTLWVPAQRLKQQLIEGKLRSPIPPNVSQLVKAGLFRILPPSMLVQLSRLSFVERMNQRYPGHPLTHHLLLLRKYSCPDQVIALYRRWFQFCQGSILQAHDHLIVEYNQAIKFYQREEWFKQYRGEKETDLT
jgi:hypothetical protein